MKKTELNLSLISHHLNNMAADFEQLNEIKLDGDSNDFNNLEEQILLVFKSNILK